MPNVSAQARIAAPPGQLFALSQDYYLRREWDPFTRRIEFLDGARAPAVGVRTRGRSWHGFSMIVEYISYKPPRQAAMKMVSGPWFFSHFAGTWIFDADGAGSSQVTFRYTYKLRGPFFALMLGPIVGFVFRRDVRRRVEGLKRAAETSDVLSRLPARHDD